MNTNDIENAKQLLRNKGYFVDSLWSVVDVTMNYKCTNKQAEKVLARVFDNDSVYQSIWEAISYEAENMNLKRID
jgi:hypothetical protein